MTRAIRDDSLATRVIVLTTFDNDEMVFDAIAIGARSTHLKDAEESDILAAIRGQAAFPANRRKADGRTAPHARDEPASKPEAMPNC